MALQCAMAHQPGPESLPSSWTSESSGRILPLLVPRASFACSSSNFLARRNCSFSMNVWGATWKRETKGQTQKVGVLWGAAFPQGPWEPSLPPKSHTHWDQGRTHSSTTRPHGTQQPYEPRIYHSFPSFSVHCELRPLDILSL